MKHSINILVMVALLICACTPDNVKKIANKVEEKLVTKEKRYHYNSGELRMIKTINTETMTFEGPFYMWHKNGKYALKGQMVNSERHGEIIYYDQQEIPNCYAYYDNGIKTGKWIYLEKGDTTKIAVFENGELVSEEKR